MQAKPARTFGKNSGSPPGASGASDARRMAARTKRTLAALACLTAALVQLGCAKRDTVAVDPQLTTLGTVEVTAELIEIPGTPPDDALYNYTYVMKYRVLSVHRGTVATPEIFVGHYNPNKPRATVADDQSGEIGGRVEHFRVGDIHHMALAEPLDQNWMGGTLDKYFGQPGPRYWALWTNPASE
jgi:hypothetical protein